MESLTLLAQAAQQTSTAETIVGGIIVVAGMIFSGFVIWCMMRD